MHQLLTCYDPSLSPFNLPPARNINPGLSPAVETVIAKATQPDVTARFQTAEEMKQVLAGRAPVPVAPRQAVSAPVTTVTPYTLAPGLVAHSVEELVQICEQDWERAVSQFSNGYFETWLRETHQYGLADEADRIANRVKAGDQFQRSLGLAEWLAATGHSKDRDVLQCPTLLDGGLVPLGTTVEMPLNLANTGTGYLFGRVSAMVPWLAVSQSYFGCSPGNTTRIKIQMRTTGLPGAPTSGIEALLVESRSGRQVIRVQAHVQGLSPQNAGRVTQLTSLSTGLTAQVAWSPDSMLLASGANEKTVRVWRISDRQPLCTLEGHRGRVYSVAFSSDGGLLASGSDDYTARLWRVSDGQPLHTLEGHRGRVYSVAFSPDGGLLASGSDDKTVRLWRVSDGQPQRALKGHTKGVYSVAFSPDGRMLASGADDETVRLWRAADGQSLCTLKGHKGWVYGVAFSPDGGLLASGSSDKTIRLWHVADGQTLRTLKGHTKGAYSIAFSPDGGLLASGSYDKTVRLWRVADGQPLCTLKGHTGVVWSVAFSPNGALLASGSYDGTVQLWGVG